METSTGLVFDIRHGALHDGPGTRTTVLLKGCPLHCAWCVNPEGQSAAPEILFYQERCTRCGRCVSVCPVNAVVEDGERYRTDHLHCTMCADCITECESGAREICGREMSAADVMAEILPQQEVFRATGGGVTLSGGEPMLQRVFAQAVLEGCRERGIHTALDTCGCAVWESFDAVRSLVDVFLFDVKLVDEAEHIRFTGVSNHAILDNLESLAQHGHAIILRVPLIPGVTDSEANLRQIAALAARLPSIQRVDLLPFNDAALAKYPHLDRTFGLKDLPPAPHANDARATATLRAYSLPVRLEE